MSWVILVNCLRCSIFNVHTILCTLFNFCRNFKLVVTSKGQLSCVDDLGIFCITKRLSKICFRCCSDETIFKLDVKLSCYIFSCYRVVCFNICYVDIQVFAIIFICHTNRLNIVCFSEFSCIQPYLVVYFITFFECLRIDILSFVVGSSVRIWVGICVCHLILQFTIIVEKFHTCKIEFGFVQDVFLWIEIRSFWRTNSIVEFFIRDFANFRYEKFSSSVM